LNAVSGEVLIMGRMKDRIIQEDEQGWKFRDDLSICYRCVSDQYLKQMIKNQADVMACSFCGRTSRKAPSCIQFNDFMDVYAGAILKYYNHAENEAIAWDSEDQQYDGATYDTWDLVRDVLPPSDREGVLDTIIDSFGPNTWCERNPYSLSDFDQYRYGWEEFCDTVKHKLRYFFNDVDSPDGGSESIPVHKMLEGLGDLIDQYSLVITLPIDTLFFRIRVHNRNETCDNWESLGSPSPEKCVSNRMSAAGISVFYAALDVRTAKAETVANLKDSDKKILTGAMWKNTQPIRTLDFTKLPEIPDFYAPHDPYERERLMFLHHFVENITQPVTHDGREHIDYVPTQILTEFFRYRFHTEGNAQLDAIVYPSAQRKHGKSIVIFASHDDLNPQSEIGQQVDGPMLVLDSASIRRLRRRRYRP
jgi:hypothetical protein